ncbi:Uncharacterised protein [Mycobacteroides abscessus subsp. abscessus]|nr:Uncharacterised protein [Mycobacteroides abscessus subsp. abscessus]
MPAPMIAVLGPVMALLAIRRTHAAACEQFWKSVQSECTQILKCVYTLFRLWP